MSGWSDVPRRVGVATALLACVLCSDCRRKKAAEPVVPPDAGPLIEPTKAVKIVYPSAPGSFVDVVDSIAPAIVTLRAVSAQNTGPAADFPGSGDDYTDNNTDDPTDPRRSLGTGFIVSNDGHVLTSDRVIASAGQLRAVLSDGREYPARVVGRDPKLDVALLQVDDATGFKPARLGESKNLKVGEWVVALGNPFGYETTAAAGIVTATGASSREVFVGPHRGFHGFLQIDATISSANAGGPVVNMAGEVVGIASQLPGNRVDIGFAVPISRAKAIIPMLKKDGAVSRPWLGIYVAAVTAELAAKYGLEQTGGAVITSVVADGPGSRAGLRAGDVILEMNGDAVDHQKLPWLLSTTGVGRAITFTIWRGQARREVKMTTEKMPE